MDGWIYGSEDDDASREGLEIGQYVKYVPDTYVNPEDGSSNYSLPSNVSGYDTNQEIAQAQDLTWRIMSINTDGTVDLISNTTEDKGVDIFLKGATGYNNGVYILNDIAAKQYSNLSLGVTARSVNIEDIENVIRENASEVEIKYLSRDEQLNMMQNWLEEDANILEPYRGSEDNSPFRTILIVNVKDNEDIQKIMEAVKDMPGTYKTFDNIEQNPYLLFLSRILYR